MTEVEKLADIAATLIRQQSARIAALEEALRKFVKHMESDDFAFGDNPSDCYEAARLALGRSE